MLKKFNVLAALILPLVVCGLTACKEETPKNDLQVLFEKMKDNNFSVDFTGSYANSNNIPINEKFYYTDYALQAEGDLGFSGIAQKDDVVFRYNFEGDDIVTGSPIINPYSGMRYENVFDYTYGMQDFDVDQLPTTKNEDGYYYYEHDKSIKNDTIFQALFLRQTYTGINPKEIKIKVVKDVIMIEATILTYISGDKDIVKTTIYDIGKTENAEIKAYLDTGKGAKKPLDLRFHNLIHPYLFTHNYTIEFDATGMGMDFKMTEYCTENAVLDVNEDGTNQGYLYNQGAVNLFTVDNDKLNITATPIADSDGSFYTSLYGGLLTYSFMDLSHDYFLGYIDEEHENSYYLTDSQVVYILSYISFVEIYEERYCDKVRLEIVDEEKHEFNLYFELYNKTANKELGTYVARFRDLNNTEIKACDRYLNKGDDPLTQTKDDLNNVLNKFRSGNYSRDSMTGAGLAKIYHTENYFYEELYGSPNQNIGYIKEGDSIYEFSYFNKLQVVDRTVDYASEGSSTRMQMPGCGSYFGAKDDLGYFSHLDEELYNLDNYKVGTLSGMNVWEITDVELSNKIFNYVFNNETIILNLGVGLLVSNSNDGYDTRVSFIISYVASDGSFENYRSYTFYDINSTSFSLLEK